MRRIGFALFCLISLLLIGCTSPSINLKTSKVTLNLHQRYTIEKDKDYTVTDDLDVKLLAVDEDICTIDGMSIIANSVGTKNVKIALVSNEKIYKEIEVIVEQEAADVFNLNLLTTTINLGVDQSRTIVKDIDYTIDGNEDIKLVSSDENICIINGKNIIAKAIGSAKVKVIVSGYEHVYKEIEVVVIKMIKSLSLSGGSTVEVDKEIVLTATYEVGIDVNFVWSSSDSTVATVNNGVVKGIKQGQAVITLLDTISNVKATKAITVNPSDEQIAQEILDWALSRIGTEAIDSVSLPKTHPTYQSQITWDSDDNVLFDPSTGFLDMVLVDQKINVTCFVTYKDSSVSKTIEFTILGYAIDDMSLKFLSNFKGGRIYADMTLPTSYTNYGGTTITWSSDNQFVFNNYGVYTKPFDNTPIKITYTIKLTNPAVEKTYITYVTAEGMNIEEKGAVVKTWIMANVGENETLRNDSYLPSYIDDYNCTVEWYNTNGARLELAIEVNNPILNDNGIYVVAKISIDGKSTKLNLYFKTESVQYTNIWDLIDLFVATIASGSLTTYSYNLVNWTSIELGYIPFVTNTKAEVVVDILPYTYGKQRTNILKASTEYIVIHDTGNPNSGADGAAHARTINNYNNNDSPDQAYISWHYTIDDDRSYQHLPLNEVAYHAGDGSYVFGDEYQNTTYNKWCIGGGNRNGIGIESCIDKGSDYTQTMRHMAKLVAELLIEFRLGFDRIKQHYDFSGKNCPQVMRENNRWNEFLYLVHLEYFLKTTLKDVTFEWTSLSSFLNNNGQITSAQPIGTQVQYKVKATYNGVEKTYTNSAVLQNRS